MPTSGARTLPTVELADVVRLWFHRQGLAQPRGQVRMTKTNVTNHLERTAALQIDTINVVERAHYLTLWSRFGSYDRGKLDRWLYRDRVAYEYWGHEASILPVSHLPIGRRRMIGFPPPSWKARSWWRVYQTSAASKRRVLKRLRDEGPLESVNFEARSGEASAGNWADPATLKKEDARSLKLLWHAGRVAVRSRRHFRCVYDLAERVYPEGPAVTQGDYEDSWLLQGLSGNGVASERHLINYVTGPEPKTAERKRIIQRNLRRERIVEVRVKDMRGTYYALPEHLDVLRKLPDPKGTNLICPFDSLIWQRKRAEELLGFRYRIEIYTPPTKREFGYYVLPILHDGKLVGRLDPKLHRDRGELEVKAIYLERGFKRSAAFDRLLAETLHDVRQFVSADKLILPKRWTKIG